MGLRRNVWNAPSGGKRGTEDENLKEGITLLLLREGNASRERRRRWLAYRSAWLVGSEYLTVGQNGKERTSRNESSKQQQQQESDSVVSACSLIHPGFWSTGSIILVFNPQRFVIIYFFLLLLLLLLLFFFSPPPSQSSISRSSILHLPPF